MKIIVKVYEEIKYLYELNPRYSNDKIEWIDNNGINTPYRVSHVMHK